MVLIGLIFQALAGTIYGISYLIGEKRINEWKDSTKVWLTNDKNRVKLSYLLTFFTPLAFFIYIYTTQKNDIEWYNLIPGLIIPWGFIALTYTSFLLSLTKSKKLANIFNNPRVNQVMRNSNIILIFLGIILMILGGIVASRQAGLVIGTNISSVIIPIILLAAAMTAFIIGFVLVFMPAIYYLYMLCVSGVSILIKPGKTVWILALSLFLTGSVFLIIHEIIFG